MGKNELQELETLQDRPFNHIYWSPMGNICLLAAMGDDVGPHNGRLEVRYCCFSDGVTTIRGGGSPFLEYSMRMSTDLPNRDMIMIYFNIMLVLRNLQFYDVENQATLKQTEHFRCNYIEWDPSGRYACTAVSQPVTGSHWKAQMDNGYQLYSFQASVLLV